MKHDEHIWLAMADACFDATEMTVTDRFNWAKEHGCRSIEAGQRCIENPESYEEAMSASGLGIHGINVWVPGDDFFRQAVEVAVRCKATYITQQVPKQAHIGDVIRFIAERKAQCAAAGLDYLIETHRWTATESLEETETILRALPEQRIVSDVSHYIPLLKNRKDFTFLHERTAAVHIRVAMPNNAQVEVGPDANHDGCKLFQGIWQDLLDAGFTGPVTGEIIPYYVTYPRYDVVQDNAHGLELFRKTINNHPAKDHFLS